MQLLFVTSELCPLAKSGGLADVSRALPMALRSRGVDVRVLMPGYNSAIARLEDPRIETSLPPMLGIHNASLISGTPPGADLPVYLIHAPALYGRSGGLYQDGCGRDWDDNPRRFAFLARVAEFIARKGAPGWRPDIVHANDWHAGLVPFFLGLGEKPRPSTIFTIHNLAFQGNFPPAALEEAGVKRDWFTPEGVEFYGHFSFLKAALGHADKITTVSPKYGREILTPELGFGFDGVLRAREKDLVGILNGIDDDCWNPATDMALAHRYSLNDISGKRVCKADLQKRMGLEVCARPLLGFVSRLTHQKMADILAAAIPEMISSGAQLAVCGDGDPTIAQELAGMESRFPGQMAFRRYDETLAHRLQAGADILLCPARFEPCGLTQIYALRYGSIPIVRATGGLADTITNANTATLMDAHATGFAFDEASREGLLEAVARALTVFGAPLAWRRMQMTAMRQDFSWRGSTDKYLSLYAEVSGLPIPRPRDKGEGDRMRPAQEPSLPERKGSLWKEGVGA